MNQPVPRRRSPERWRGGWPREFWDPFGEFAQLWDRMGQFFESTGEGGLGGWVPAVETEETDDAYLVRAELPGMKSDDVDVELNGNELRITGEVKEEAKGKTLRRRHGKFAYRASLPTDADPAKVDAQLADGILTVRVPKAAQARSRRIEIKD
jgi:HSP20 family protein